VQGPSVVSCAKTAEPTEMQFGMLSWAGPGNHVLDVVDIGATWQIRLNRPSAAAMRPYVKLERLHSKHTDPLRIYSFQFRSAFLY